MKIRLLVLLLVAVAAATESHAQQSRNAVYFELGGNAIVPSINYERLLGERWRGRIGASWVVGETETDTNTTLVIPLTVSALNRPSSNHHFEYGGGVTIIAGDRQDLYDIGDNEEKLSTVVVTGIIGYRYQKPDGGFQFRSVFTPIAGAGDLLPWFGVSFGYAW